MSYFKQLQESKIIAILRKVDTKDVISVVHGLHKGGINVFEVTLDSPKALGVIEQLSTEVSNDVLIGAGTVLDPASAELAIQHGAKFIVSPTLDLKTIEMTKKHETLSIPGCLTPTEIFIASKNGADMVKVFPANSMGANYFKDLSGPLSHIPLIATGGINQDNILLYLEAGVSAVGLGSSLVPKKISHSDELEALTRKTEKIVQKVGEIS